MNTYATINDMQEISWKTGYLLGNVDMGIRGFTGTGYRMDDVEMLHQSSHS